MLRLLSLAVLFTGFTIPAAAVVLDFDDLLPGEFLTDQFRNQGVVFVGGPAPNLGTAGVVGTDGDFGTFSFGNSEPNFVVVGIGTLTATFVDPVTGTPTSASGVSIRVGDGDAAPENVGISAFDADGNLVFSQTLQLIVQGATVNVPGQVREVRVFGAAGTISGFAIDDFTFSAHTTIDFDDFNAGDTTAFAAADRYRSEGIVFSSDIPIADVGAVEGAGNLAIFLSVGGTAPNALALSIPGSGVLTIEASFVLPGTSVAATTESVQMLFVDTEIGSTLGTIEAFDLVGNLIDSDTRTTPAERGGVLEVSGPGIARIRFSVDADGADLDNLTFSPPTVVSEPSALAVPLTGITGENTLCHSLAHRAHERCLVNTKICGVPRAKLTRVLEKGRVEISANGELHAVGEGLVRKVGDTVGNFDKVVASLCCRNIDPYHSKRGRKQVVKTSEPVTIDVNGDFEIAEGNFLPPGVCEDPSILIRKWVPDLYPSARRALAVGGFELAP